MKDMDRVGRTDDEIEISLADLLLTFWDIRWVMAVLLILGGIVGMLFSPGGSAGFSTRASMIVTARAGDGTYQNGNPYPRPDEIYLSQNLVKTVRFLVVSDRVLTAVLEDGAYSHIQPEDLRNRIEVTAEDGTSFLWLTLSWEVEAEAVGILNRLMEVLPDIMTEVMDIGDVSVIDYAKEAVMTQQKMPLKILVGAAMGLVVGCFVGVLYYLFVPKVRGKGSLETLNLDMIGEIPLLDDTRKQGSCYLDDEGISEEYREAYGRLSVVFRYLTSQREKKIIAVTSSISGEGKSTVAYNLALRLTQTGSRVLLLDFDFKKGVLYQLVRARKPKDGEVRTESRNVEHLDKLLEKLYNGIYTIQGFQEKDIFQVDNKIFPAIRKLLEQFDYILVDTPSVGILSDVQQMRELMDGVLLVAREDTVSIGNVSKSMEFLDCSGIEIIGCVLNGRKNPFLK